MSAAPFMRSEGFAAPSEEDLASGGLAPALFDRSGGSMIWSPSWSKPTSGHGAQIDANDPKPKLVNHRLRTPSEVVFGDLV